ncbi:MAG: glycerophosphodiester phosphodiesterase [Deltaproteobacteria bacterium]|nr:glycerophosphodiester phosphodiesterase [Deltaproteobacteria bacterium]
MGSHATAGGSFWARHGVGPVLLAHRGSSVHETENTLAAFRRAMAEGADGVELDVQGCATGEVVVFHDDDLSRLAGRPERVASLPFAALREVRLLGGGEIPTLAEAIEACGPRALVNIEIKGSGIRPPGCRALVAGVAEVVGRMGAAWRVLVSSFSPAALWLWRRRRPDVPCGLLCARPRPSQRPWFPRRERLLPLLRPFAVHPEDGLCGPEAVARWHERGYAVNVWTVDAAARLQALSAMGVDGIITNDPAGARAALALTARSGGG